jgi:hypothetical protein
MKRIFGQPLKRERSRPNVRLTQPSETGAFVTYSIGQQRAQSMSQSAAKSSVKWISNATALLPFKYLDAEPTRLFAYFRP